MLFRFVVYLCTAWESDGNGSICFLDRGIVVLLESFGGTSLNFWDINMEMPFASHNQAHWRSFARHVGTPSCLKVFGPQSESSQTHVFACCAHGIWRNQDHSQSSRNSEAFCRHCGRKRDYVSAQMWYDWTVLSQWWLCRCRYVIDSMEIVFELYLSCSSTLPVFGGQTSLGVNLCPGQELFRSVVWQYANYLLLQSYHMYTRKDINLSLVCTEYIFIYTCIHIIETMYIYIADNLYLSQVICVPMGHMIYIRSLNRWTQTSES